MKIRVGYFIVLCLLAVFKPVAMAQYVVVCLFQWNL